jgi:UDP-N-acetylmuramoyl-L-alanyl-D-glutamate--2,6-diaminopimelate ligase
VNERGIAQLVARLPGETELSGNGQRTITDVTADSRTVRAGALFVAVRGERQDGHDFLDQAVAKGAAAVAIQSGAVFEAPPNVSVIRVADTRRALSSFASAFYGDPSQQIEVVGITGTNGKTTSARMLAAMLGAGGVPCAVIGTVGAEFGGRKWDLANTTPLAPVLQALLAHMRDAGARAVAMEVSSHALVLDRVADVRFAVGVLTNVTRDHLDFHGSLEAYAAAKRRLFETANACVLNVDDAHGARWAPECAQRVPTRTYALEREADLRPRAVRLRPNGSAFSLDGTEFEVNLPGRFNVANALGAIAAARFLGVDDAASARGLKTLSRVRGRMEHVGGGDVDVIVDYAHTPDALENALVTLRETSAGAIGLVFGCGGERDRGKRPQMGAVAAHLADRIYLTNDNPRGEDPGAILSEIAAGIGDESRFKAIPDRRLAIETAVREARRGDVVLVAGKGHERKQIVGKRVIEFDDVSVAREALRRRGFSA